MSKFIEHLQPRFVVGGCVLVFYIYLFTYVLVSLFMFVYMKNKGFPGGASGKESTCQGRRPKRREFSPWVGKIPWRRAWQLGTSHGGRLQGFHEQMYTER